MKEELKNTYRGIRGWIQYVRDYKDNVDSDLISQQRLIDANNDIQKLKKEIEQKEYLSKEKDNLLEKKEQRINQLTTRLSEAKQDNISKQNIIYILNEQLDTAEETIQNKNLTIKQLNMKYAQCQRKIKALEKDIQRKDYKINFLKLSKDAPSKEKVLAYEKCMKEVEKRQKEKAK